MAADFIRVVDRTTGTVQTIINRDRIMKITPNGMPNQFLVTLDVGTIIVNRNDLGALIGGDAANA